jgi:hypothetical protein
LIIDQLIPQSGFEIPGSVSFQVELPSRSKPTRRQALPREVEKRAVGAGFRGLPFLDGSEKP